MAYLFDTDAVSEVLKRRPQVTYLRWLETIAREDQFVSAVTMGELYKGAFRSPNRDRHLRNITQRILPAVTVLAYDQDVARSYGEIAAELESRGRRLADADLQIAATAVHFGLELVTGNVRHFERVSRLRLNRILAAGR